MIVETLGLQNFVSYRDRVELDFKGLRTIGIVGDNESGKSSLLRAIGYGAYGEGQTDREVKLINDRADAPLVVCLGLRLDDGSLLEIERGRSLKNEAILHATGMGGGVTAVQRQIQERIRLDWRDFVDLCYFVQGDIHGFMEGNKRAYFQRWTRSLEWWAQLEAAARALVTESESERAEQLSSLASLKQTVERAGDLKRTLEAARARLRAAERAQESAEGRVAVLTREMAREEARAASRAEAADLQDELDDLVDRLTEGKQHVANVQRELSGISSGECPLIHIACKPLKQKGAARARRLGKELMKLKAGLAALLEKQKIVKAKLAEQARQKEKEGTDKNKRDLRAAEHDLATAKQDVRAGHELVARAEVHLQAVKKARAEIKTARVEVSKIEHGLRRAKFLQFMCGRSGVPSELIVGELERVEDRCNWILDRLGYHKRIRFAAFKELAGYEKVCPRCGGETWKAGACSSCGTDRPRKRRDEPTVTVLDGTAERAFDLESGGARVLQSFAVRMAASLFVSSMTGVPLRMIMLDEVFAMLDPSNRQKLMALVLDKLVTEFGLRQQFVVSHHEDVVNAVDDLLIVKRQRGQSVARWA